MQRTRVESASHRVAAPLGVAAAAGLGCLVILLADPMTPGGLLPVCPTKSLLGIVCPGCGSLRMLHSLMHGDIAAAVRFNALGLVAVLLLVWAWAAWFYGRVTDRRVRSWQHHRWSALTTLVMVVAWFVIRNLPTAPFTALRV